jgi:hypothetical protein
VEAVVGTTEIISLLGIAGTLLGTLAGTGLQFLIERRRWRREDQTRFRNDLYKACMDLYYHTHVAVTIAGDPEDPVAEEHFGAKEDHFEPVAENYSRIKMLGSTSLEQAASDFYVAFVDIVEEGKTGEETERTYRQARTSFVDEARVELGVEIRRAHLP